VMAPAYTPATGTPEPNGLTPRETFPLIRRLCAESNVVGFELVELLPYRVSGYETVLNSERIVRECLVGITLRKKGVADKAYLAPLAVDDARKYETVDDRANKNAPIIPVGIGSGRYRDKQGLE